MEWLQDYGWLIAVLALAMLLVRSARRRLSGTSVLGAAAWRQVDLTFTVAVLVTLTVSVAVTLWLLSVAEGADPGTEKAKLRAEAVKTGTTIALGTGGAAYLLLAYRRHRLDEVDTRERRITELYTKAVEQLGHGRAPVRLGAIYSLERLAQDNPKHRQTVVDVFCAYLRMPYSPDAEQDLAQEELQVRQAVQLVIRQHFYLPPDRAIAAARRRPALSGWSYWPDITLNLTGATLIDLDLSNISIPDARFNKATFHGVTIFNDSSFQSVEFAKAIFEGPIGFERTTFEGRASFARAIFKDYVSFDEASFQDYAGFEMATFQNDARFYRATFHGTAVFLGATFQRLARFEMVVFHHDAAFGRSLAFELGGREHETIVTDFQGDAEFTGTVFAGRAFFKGATFSGLACFDNATFQNEATFSETTFRGDSRFAKATFPDNTRFDVATFEDGAWFYEATFTGGTAAAGVAGAHVLHLDNPDLNRKRQWPNGHTVRSDQTDPTRGTLVRAEDAKEPEPAVPSSDPTDSGSGTG